MRAPIDMKETYQSGEIYGSITNEWRSLIIGTGEDTQIMGEAAGSDTEHQFSSMCSGFLQEKSD